jgi:hypothetical protein
MQTTYRLKAQQISMTLLKSLKTMFAGLEVKITIKSVEPKSKTLSKPLSEVYYKWFRKTGYQRLYFPLILIFGRLFY